MKIVIIGAGPTGLGAAWRLTKIGHRDFTILEKNGYVGGLAASFVDPEGFTWDTGGHVVFSHFKTFDRILARCLGGDCYRHTRKAFIRTDGKWIPYPFQNNLRHLSREALLECVLGLLECREQKHDQSSFAALNRSVMGKGICRHFLEPYNRKVWQWPLEKMSADWIAERVSLPDLRRVLKNVILDRDDTDWGPNATFTFPKNGGTGTIFKNMAEPFGDRIHLNCPVIEVDTKRRRVATPDGEFQYDVLISTAPLDWLTRHLRPAKPRLERAARHLAKNAGVVVGIGYEKKELAHGRCWVYSPDRKVPFYRTTYFSHYSKYNTPRPGRQLALMSEISVPAGKRIDRKRIVERVIAAHVAEGFVAPADIAKIATTFVLPIENSYPIPTLDRDGALAVIQPELEKMDIFSRGRFGAWLYEKGNMDHSVMQGVEIVNVLFEAGKSSR